MNFFKSTFLKFNVFLVIFFFLLIKDSSSMYRVMGAGQKNCKIILMHQEVEQIRFIVVSWVQGFFSGLNLGVSVVENKIGAEISDDKLWESILDKCNKSPFLNLTTISQSLFFELNSVTLIQD